MVSQASILAHIWKGNGICGARIGDTFKFYRAGAPPLATGTLDTPGRRFDGATGTYDPTTGRYDDQSGDFDSAGTLDAPANPDFIDQTKLDATSATFDRSNATMDAPGNYLFALPVSLNACDMSYGKPNGYAKATWYALVDGSDLEPGLYFVGTQGTFFIAAMQPLLPILVVECNRMISVFRPSNGQDNQLGVLAYGGNTAKHEKPVIQGVPASVLQGTKGEKSETGLPGDNRSPWVAILMPYLGINIATDDIITDDLGKRYVASNVELTSLGYRISAIQAVT